MSAWKRAHRKGQYLRGRGRERSLLECTTDISQRAFRQFFGTSIEERVLDFKLSGGFTVRSFSEQRRAGQRDTAQIAADTSAKDSRCARAPPQTKGPSGLGDASVHRALRGFLPFLPCGRRGRGAGRGRRLVLLVRPGAVGGTRRGGARRSVRRRHGWRKFRRRVKATEEG